MSGVRRILLSGDGWPYLLVPFIPIAIVLELTHAAATIIFAASALGVIPTAALMGKATDELAARSGPGIGGFLNVTFGNAPELIIAFFALNEGLQEVVKASLIGSILGNILLVMGAAMLVGGLKYKTQTFDRTAASTQAGMLLLAVVALVLPAVFQLVEGGGLPGPPRSPSGSRAISRPCRSPSRSCSCSRTWSVSSSRCAPTPTSSTRITPRMRRTTRSPGACAVR